MPRKTFLRPDNAAISKIGCIAWLLALVASSIVAAGGLEREFHHADEPAHFVTGVLVHDYLCSGSYTQPITFAEEFYARYPKVAFGHWPPLYHAVQGLWYCIVGVSKTSAIALAGVLAAITGISMYLWLLRRFGHLIAITTCTLFLLMPLPRLFTTRVMSEMLVTLLCLLAFCALNSALERRRWRHLWLFGCCGALALLTKENSLPIVLTFPVALAATTRIGVLRNISFWITICVLATAGLGLVTMQLYGEHGWHGMHSFGDLLALIRRSDPSQSLENHLQIAHPMILTVAALGIAYAVFAFRNQGRQTAVPAIIATIWLIASVMFFAMLPFFEPRYLMPTLIPVLVLFTYGVSALGSLLQRRWAWGGHAVALAVAAIAIVFSVEELPPQNSGFYHPARSIPSGDQSPILLIASDPPGEGDFIVERLMIDPNRSGFVFRASKLLASSSWSGRQYQLRYESPEEIACLLNQIPVDFVVYDHHAWTGLEPDAHHSLLRQALDSCPDKFLEIGRFAGVRNGVAIEHAVSVYLNRSAVDD